MLLLGEGSSDQCLLPPLRWMVGRTTPARVVVDWADMSIFETGKKLSDKVGACYQSYQPDLLFIHRDSDQQSPKLRYQEIAEAAQAIPHVPVVAIKAMETWLLHDEMAIRKAVGRPSGREPLGLPRCSQLEDVTDPKQVLKGALYQALNEQGRRRDRFDPDQAKRRVADLVEDWSPLLALTAIQQLQADLVQALARLGLPICDGLSTSR